MTAVLVPYTNTYTDVDGNIADADDIIAEFTRIETFINNWAISYQTIGLTVVTEYPADAIENFEIDPALGIVQRLIIDANVEDIDINIQPRADGDPYRIYLSLRFRSKDTRFTVSAPVGSGHLFGINQAEYSPGQVVADDFYPAVLIITYGTDATHVQVFAHNAEATTGGRDDILQGIAL